MTHETSMLRIRKDLRDRLKAEAAKQGRTMEWVANDAIDEYLSPKIVTTDPMASFKTISAAPRTEPTVEPFMGSA